MDNLVGNSLVNLAFLPLMVGMVLFVAACYIIAAILVIPVWLLVILGRGWQDVTA